MLIVSFLCLSSVSRNKKDEGEGEEQDTGVFESNLKLSRREGSDKGEGDEIEAQLVGRE